MTRVFDNESYIHFGFINIHIVGNTPSVLLHLPLQRSVTNAWVPKMQYSLNTNHQNWFLSKTMKFDAQEH